MAYYFMVQPKIGTYEPIEIKNSIYFEVEKRQYVKPCAYSLSEIDSFTTRFNDEIELRDTLLSEGLLDPELGEKSLSIRFFNKNNYKKVRYDFLYQKDLKYIQNPELVIEFVMNKFHENDFLFIQKLAANFSNYHECANTATEVMHGAAHSLYNGKRHEMLDRFDLNGDLLTARLVKLIIYKYTTDFNGYTRYKEEVNYRNLHTIIAFINNYYKDKTETETKPKVRSRIKTEVPGQLSFFHFTEE